MTEKDFIVRLAALVTTLLDVEETHPGPAPASPVYLAFGTDMSVYESVTEAAVRLGWILKTSTTLQLTEKGREMAVKFNKAMKPA